MFYAQRRKRPVVPRRASSCPGQKKQNFANKTIFPHVFIKYTPTMPLIKPHTNLTKNSIFSVENSLKIGYHHQRFSSLHPTYLHASKSTFQHSVIPCHTPSRPVMPCCAPSRPVAPRCALSRLVAPRRAPSRPVAPCCTL